MKRVTNAVLATKIDAIHETLKDDIKPAVKANTEFRLKFKGVVMAVSGFSAVLSASIVTFLTKIFK